MRLNEKAVLFFRILLVELGIIALIGVVFYFQFDNAKDEVVSKTRAIAETIGGQASSFHRLRGGESTSGEFYRFLDERLGREKLFNTFDVSPKFFSVTFNNAEGDGPPSGHFMKDSYAPEQYSVEKYGGRISVSVPFLTTRTEDPLGIVKIDSDTSAIMKKVFADNFLLYVAMLVLFNNQAFILYLFTRRKREPIPFAGDAEGYLREHSVSALRIMHKVLGDIIEDHASRDAKAPDGKDKDAASGNVIPISNVGGSAEE